MHASPPSSTPARRDVGVEVDVVLGLGALVVLALAAWMQPGDGAVVLFGYDVPVLCGWRRLTGWSCPGCGLTRSFVDMAHGDLAGAWHHHRAGPLLFAAVVAFVPWRAVVQWRRRARVRGAA